jgi:tetratricopeptide (TPR) repeat protein
MRPSRTALIGLLAWSAIAHAADQSFGDRIEMLDWSDPERAAKMIDEPALGKARDSDVQFQEVRGMVFADVRRDADVDATVQRLQAMIDDGDQSAVLAQHYVRAYSLYQREQYSAARDELNHIDMKAITSDAEAYRVSILRGNTLRTLGQAEAALPFLEDGLDLAREMHDDQRTLHALLWLTRIYTTTGNYDRASEEIQSSPPPWATRRPSPRSRSAPPTSRIARVIPRRNGTRASRRSTMPSSPEATSGWRAPA